MIIYDKEKHQVLTLKQMEPANQSVKNWLKQLIDYQSSSQLIFLLTFN